MHSESCSLQFYLQISCFAVMQVHLHTCSCSFFQPTYFRTIICTSLNCYFSSLLKSSVVCVTDLILLLFTSLIGGELKSSDMDF